MSLSVPNVESVDRRQLLVSGGAALATLVAGSSSVAGATEERPELMTIFEHHEVVGTFVLYDAPADRVVTVNRPRAEKRYVPASTFKIANSLIALEAGVVRDENEVIPYGGKPQPFKAWEKDMPMREAISASNVPIYQELARRIGLELYKQWLDRLDYGNRQTGSSVDTFWLDGPLEISAIEQARFVAALAQQKLLASPRAQGIVCDILHLETTDGRALYGKTGWRFSSTPQLRWWTGWVQRNGKIVAFALNIDMTSPADAKKRVAIGRDMLGKLVVL
jgi:beta-lactamase class D